MLMSSPDYSCVSLYLVAVITDAKGKMLLHMDAERKCWSLPQLPLAVSSSLAKAITDLLHSEFGESVSYKNLIGLFNSRASSGRAPALFIAVTGEHSLPATLLNTRVEGLFFEPGDLPSFSDVIHLEILTAFLAGRRGVLG
ncbi:MAG: hypothetical protein FWE76_01500 [Symbiobacteriaceae bacterium]|nr:hypothetical protein [Symbiobacteriaceae bacterium]